MALREWLEADGLGGFASGNEDGTRARRYHAWLLVATTPPTGRRVLVSGADAFVTTSRGRFAVSSQRYRDGVVAPDGRARVAAFSASPWPTWTYDLGDGVRVVHELFVPKGAPAVVSTWRIEGEHDGATLEVRPFLAGRDYHALRAPGAPAAELVRADASSVQWHLTAAPDVLALHDGRYEHQPHEYHAFDYEIERARGFDCREDLTSPGVFHFDLGAREAVLVFRAAEAGAAPPAEDARALVDTLRAHERTRRAAFASRLHAAADSYLVRRASGATVIAGYPWFTDWGRDTFIALRGLCLVTGRLQEARDILCEWARHLDGGMLPNRFPDVGEQPEFNAADAALWFVVAAHELLTHADSATVLRPADRKLLHATILAIVAGYREGTRHGIVADGDLLAAGEPGVQLTWMDARVGDWVVTPRSGKPVELQALWCNALAAASAIDHDLRHQLMRTVKAFTERFWRDDLGCLVDVVDVDHGDGDDRALRPNQIFAVGGLPFAVLEGARARAVVDTVERHLLTPVGLRSLAPEHPAYTGRYAGGPRSRDAAYHNGTVWPWLLGPFAEAWVRVRGNTPSAVAEARARFLVPLLAQLDVAGIGHLAEVADGDAPHLFGGCPFQAWSVGEALRLQETVLVAHAPARAGEGAGATRVPPMERIARKP